MHVYACSPSVDTPLRLQQGSLLFELHPSIWLTCPSAACQPTTPSAHPPTPPLECNTCMRPLMIGPLCFLLLLLLLFCVCILYFIYYITYCFFITIINITDGQRTCRSRCVLPRIAALPWPPCHPTIGPAAAVHACTLPTSKGVSYLSPTSD